MQEPLKRTDGVNNLSFDRFKFYAETLGGRDSYYNNVLKNKRVCIVGPSPSLKNSNQGGFIDSFDIVVRVNRGFPVSVDTEDIGSKTSIHYHCLNTDEYSGGKVYLDELHKSNVILSCPYPKNVFPFHADIVKFEKDNQERVKYHYIDTDFYMKCADLIGTRPNSGVCAIIDLLCFNIKSLHVTGFTFFKDGWRKSYKDTKQVFGEEKGKTILDEWLTSNFNGNHFQKPQEDLIREIYLNDDRITIDDTMKEILEVE